jgi:CrcB protein
MNYRIVWLALAGTCGTLARYWMSGAVYDLLGRNFPWGTAAVNILGCLLFGAVWVLAEERFILSSETRVVVLIGFMGAFTTFSSLIFESNQLMRDSQWLYAMLNMVGESILGFAGLWLGMALGRLI